MDDSADKHEKHDADPATAAQRPEHTDADAASDDPSTDRALGAITLGGGASPYAGAIAAPEDEPAVDQQPPEARESSDPAVSSG